MNSRDGRYAPEPVLEHSASDGTAIRYVRLRILPPVGSYAVTAPHRVSDNDREDLIAFQRLGTPTAWWMIDDANPISHPDQLLDETGSTILIPAPGTQVVNK